MMISDVMRNIEINELDNEGSESLNNEPQGWERSPQSRLVVLPCFIMWIASSTRLF